MAMRRTQRGGPAPRTGPRDSDGARLVKPAPTKASSDGSQRMREMMTPSRPARGPMLREQLNLNFFQEAIGELRKVHWPTREQTRNLTILVIVVSLAIGILLGGFDYIFEKLFEFILRVR